jgi:AcrR family transcriptional regulator
MTAERAATRTELLDGAERLLGRIGYGQLTMETIASESGVARRTVYLYFGSKEDVVLGTVDRIVEQVIARLTSIAAEALPAPERLARMLVARVMVRFEAVHTYHRALDGIFAALRPAVLARRRAYFAGEAGLLARVIKDGTRAGELSPGRPRALAELLLVCTNSLLPHGLSASEIADRRRTQARARAVATLLVDGLRPS